MSFFKEADSFMFALSSPYDGVHLRRLLAFLPPSQWMQVSVKVTFKNIIGCKRSTPDQKLELMMTELDQAKMRIFDQKFSKDGLDCRQVISFQHFQSASEVGH